MKRIILLGAGGHAKSVADTIEMQKEYKIEGFISPDEPGKTVYNSYQVIGNDKDLQKIYESGVKYAFVTIGFMGNSVIREQLYKKLKQTGFVIPKIIDNTAVLAQEAEVGEGTYVGKNVVINSDACIGKMCIINTSAVVEHETVVEDFSHISVGTVLCGQTHIGKSTLVGANSVVIENRTVGDRCIIGAGSVIINNIPDNSKVVGNPGNTIRS